MYFAPTAQEMIRLLDVVEVGIRGPLQIGVMAQPRSGQLAFRGVTPTGPSELGNRLDVSSTQRPDDRLWTTSHRLSYGGYLIETGL